MNAAALVLVEQAHQRVGQSAELGLEEAVRSSPVDTGLLASSWRLTPSEEGTWQLENDAPYAGVVEFGTINRAPQPMLRNAVDVMQSDLAS